MTDAANPGLARPTILYPIAGAVFAMGLKQADLATRAGVGRKFLWQVESGKATLRSDKVMRVLEELSLMPLIVPRELLGMLR